MTNLTSLDFDTKYQKTSPKTQKHINCTFITNKMHLEFTKYHGAGNDFIMVDGFKNQEIMHQLSKDDIAFVCKRHFGIGADGLIIISPLVGYDLEMIYYNSDGAISSMCGNGGRCTVQFAHSLGYVEGNIRFLAADGPHKGRIETDGISISMSNVKHVENISGSSCYMNTGSPHYVSQLDSNVSLQSLDLVTQARRIRYNDRFFKEGTNVNFITRDSDTVQIRTYERGVEDETLACGTGVVAAAIVSRLGVNGHHSVQVAARGGLLRVDFDTVGDIYQNIWLFGPAQAIFSGVIEL